MVQSVYWDPMERQLNNNNLRKLSKNLIRFWNISVSYYFNIRTFWSAACIGAVVRRWSAACIGAVVRRWSAACIGADARRWSAACIGAVARRWSAACIGAVARRWSAACIGAVARRWPHRHWGKLHLQPGPVLFVILSVRERTVMDEPQPPLTGNKNPQLALYLQGELLASPAVALARGYLTARRLNTHIATLGETAVAIEFRKKNQIWHGNSSAAL